MKKIILLVITVLILSTGFISAQEGRPQYKIRNERAGVYIGDIIIELLPYVAPLQTAYFDSLVTISFYDSLAWHRVVPNFVIQGGDPNSKHGPRETWGEGDTTQTNIKAEFSKVNQLRGIIGAARDTDINSANSQFYVNTANNSSLTNNYTSYGIVVEGMDVVDDIEASPRDALDNPFDKIEMFVTKIGVNESVPGTPTLTAPIDGKTAFTPDTLLAWSTVEDAILYFVEFSLAPTFAEITFADTVANSTNPLTYKYKDVELGEKTFYWRVRCSNGAKFSEYSEIRDFTTSIAMPVLSSPPDSSTSLVLNPLLQWEPVEGADSYNLQMVRNFANFNPQRLLVNESGITATEWQLENLEPNIRYYWRVSAHSSGSESPFTNDWLFTTEAATDIEDETIPTEYSLTQNYPNPFNPSTTIKFGLPEQGFIDLRVYNMLGQEVARLVNQELTAGYHEVNFGLNNIASGVYIYRIDVKGKFSSVKKMLMLK